MVSPDQEHWYVNDVNSCFRSLLAFRVYILERNRTVCIFFSMSGIFVNYVLLLIHQNFCTVYSWYPLLLTLICASSCLFILLDGNGCISEYMTTSDVTLTKPISHLAFSSIIQLRTATVPWLHWC